MTRSLLVTVASLALSACNGLDLSDNYYFETSTSSASGTLVTGQLPSTGDPGTTGGDSTSSGIGDASTGTVADTSTSGPVDPATSSTSSDSDTLGGATACQPPARKSKRSYVFVTPYRFYGDLTPNMVDIPADEAASLKNATDKAKDAINGRVGNLAVADAICQHFAEEGNLAGKYVAWLSSGDFIGNIMVFLNTNGATSAPRHFTRTDDECVADSWTAWISPTHLAAVNMTQKQEGIPPEARAWTGTGDVGTSTGIHCTWWLSPAATDSGTAGHTQQRMDTWSDAGPHNCTDSHHLYCLQYAD